MASLKASQQGLTQIKQAIAQKGWKIGDDRWLVEASKVLEPQGDWHESGPYAYGCSSQTWERFLQGTAIRDRSFIAFCQVLNINPDEVIESLNCLREDWGDAPDVPIFFGRNQELTQLEQWLLRDRYQLIAIVGLAGVGKTRLVRGGIGKTDLSLQLARRVRGEFECLIWRRLLNAPPLEELLVELIEFVSEHQVAHLAETPDGLVTQLVQYLKQRRCLLILDNAESILQGGVGQLSAMESYADRYRIGYESYGKLFKRIGETHHQSCLLITSREKPQDIEDMEGVWPVRSLELRGIDTEAGKSLFQGIGQSYNAIFHGSDENWQTLITFYNGNPLALEVAARHILRRFGGNLRKFLAQNHRVFGKIRDLLDWHFERLSPSEKTIMYWLAINREAIAIVDLQEDILSSSASKQVPETLDTLERQIPIERSDDRISIQPVLIEYVTERLITKICNEFKTGKLELLISHALIKATAKDYVRDSQIRVILNPAIECIRSATEFGEANAKRQDYVERQLSQILSNLKRSYQKHSGYAAGNLLNLMRHGDIDISRYDFSDLTIWQADLQGISLHHVNFANCEFAKNNFTQHFGGVHSSAFYPERDILAIGDSNGHIRLFHLKDRQQWLCLEGHVKSAWVTSLAFSPNGNLLASASLDHTARLWDTQTGECLRIFSDHKRWLWAIAFSPDGTTVASGGNDNAIRLWHINTDYCQTLEGHQGWVWAVAFDPKGQILASGGYDNSIRLWNLETGNCFKCLKGHENAVWSVAFHPEGRILASGSVDNTVKLWDVQTGECLHTLRGHTKEVRSIAFGADGEVIVSGSFDHTIKIWNSYTGELLRTLTGHGDELRIVTVNTDSTILASGDNCQVLKLWDVHTGRCLKTWQGYVNWLWTIAIAPDGRSIACGSLDQTIRFWNSDTGQLTRTLSGHRNWVWSVVFSPDGQLLASGSDDETIKIWDIATGQCLSTLRGHTNGGVWSVDFSPDGKLLASGGQDGRIRFWNTRTWESSQCLDAHNNWIWSVKFSPDGQILASGSADQTIKIWNSKTGKCLMSIEKFQSAVMAVAFSPDSQTLVSGEEYENVRLWDIRTGECIKTLSAHTDSIMSVAFSPNGQIICSASADETIRLWNTHTGLCLNVLEGHTAVVSAIAFTPDGQTLVSSSTDGTIWIWDVQTGKPLRQLRPKRPYEGMKITGATGFAAAQRDALIALGATD